jgi:hypothetical protein
VEKNFEKVKRTRLIFNGKLPAAERQKAEAISQLAEAGR